MLERKRRFKNVRVMENEGAGGKKTGGKEKDPRRPGTAPIQSQAAEADNRS